MSEKKKILIVVNNLSFFISHRLPIAFAAQKSGYIVDIAFGSPQNFQPYVAKLQGITLHFVLMQRGGLNPLADIYSCMLLWKLFRRIRPDIVHLVTIKPLLYGGIVARLVGVPALVSTIAGLGFVFSSTKSIQAFLLRRMLKPLFRLACHHPNQVLIFQNPDDRTTIVAMTKISLHKTRLVRGAGVDVDVCVYTPEPKGTPVVAMACRLLRDKGVYECVQAARILRKRLVSVRFWLIGAPDLVNPSSINEKDIHMWHNEGLVDFLGFRQDVPILYAQSHIVILPSYREGLPKSLIEAAACGRAVITTDTPGCRDAITPNVTGLLVPPKDANALADAIEYLVQNSALRQSMGRAARALAEKEFVIDKIVQEHIHIYQQLLSTE